MHHHHFYPSLFLSEKTQFSHPLLTNSVLYPFHSLDDPLPIQVCQSFSSAVELKATDSAADADLQVFHLTCDPVAVLLLMLLSKCSGSHTTGTFSVQVVGHQDSWVCFFCSVALASSQFLIWDFTVSQIHRII